MCVCVYPNGVGKGEGNHLSVFLHIIGLIAGSSVIEVKSQLVQSIS